MLVAQKRTASKTNDADEYLMMVFFLSIRRRGCWHSFSGSD